MVRLVKRLCKGLLIDYNTDGAQRGSRVVENLGERYCPEPESFYDWEMFRARIKENGKCLVTRKAVIQGFIDDVLPPQDVLDPMERMENIPDIDHA
ncbi:LOW QUALITY PROTEIN: hypothetical protein PHMEG_00035242 [Phytophthora megakarya]|uniref:Uncharacterized protein n=1 Tax=Phytophthora megakarya TaxID=4795 RepID=A0A225UP63_9STRA|nr:LOW QUALITY PROTEIN: hypothetical protein PHMEG_00035242 [Phytophthora megakarya]